MVKLAGSIADKFQQEGVQIDDMYAIALENHAHEQASLILRIEAANAYDTSLLEPIADDYANNAVASLERVGDEAEALIDAVADRRLDLAVHLRHFMVEEGITRPARKSSPVATAAKLQCFLLLEAGAAATALAADGHMTITAALLTGTVLSGVNIALGVATGFFGLRGSRYRAEAPQPKRWDRAIRMASAGFAALGFVTMGTMHFLAARVRLIGDHAGIWDWGKASFLTTFNDYNAVALILIGALSSLVAVREGWSQLADPIWGYSRVTRETERQISVAIDNACEDGAQRLEAAFERSLAIVEGAVADGEDSSAGRCADLQDLREDVGRFNTDLKLTLARLKTAKAKEEKLRQYLAGVGRKSEPVTLDFAALKALKIDPSKIPADPNPLPTSDDPALRLEDAFEEASARLDAAHASASSFITRPFF